GIGPENVVREWHRKDLLDDRIIRGDIAQALESSGSVAVHCEFDDTGSHFTNRLRRFDKSRLRGELVAGADGLGAHDIIEAVHGRKRRWSGGRFGTVHGWNSQAEGCGAGMFQELAAGEPMPGSVDGLRDCHNVIHSSWLR